VLGRPFREELLRGSSVNIAFIVSNLLIQLVAGLAIAAFLGPEGVGAFAVGMLVLDFSMVLVHLPGVAFVREFSSREREEALATVAALKLLLCIPASAAILILAGPLASAFRVSPLMIALLGLYPPLSAVASIATMVFEARRKMGRRNLPGLAENVARLGAVIALTSGAVLLPSRPDAAALAWVLGAIPSAAVSFALAGFPDLRLLHLERARDYFSFGWRTTLAHLLQKQLLWVGTAAIYLAFLPSSLALAQSESGLFKISYSMMFYIVLLGSAVPAMLYPLLARAFALEDEAARRAEVHRLLSIAFYAEVVLAAPLAVALVLAAPWAFSALLPGFSAAAPLAQLLAVSGVLFCLTLPAAVLLPASNRPDLILRLFVAQAAVAVALNAILVPQTGAPWGGAMGAVIADWVTAAVGLAYAHALVRKLGIPPPSFATFRAAFERGTPQAPS